jgi:hypothetical protein
MKHFALICLLLVSLCSCPPAPDCKDMGITNPCPRVLFIGKSYTSINDLPGMVRGGQNAS